MQKLNIKSDRTQILNSSLIGLEFEFYSESSVEETQKSLSQLLGKKIRVEDKAHSDFQPTTDEFKLEPDMSGGKGLVELVTGATPYRNARIIIIKVLKWIRENGYTTDRASIHINLSFDPKFLEDKLMVSKMNVLKFILEFDEDQVYRFFPDRKDSTYAKSIKWIMPREESYYYDESHTSSNNFKFADTKYYGINFSKKEKNYLEFRYIGGKDYENRQEDILYLTERFISQIWKSCNDPRFSQDNKLELKKILNKNKPLIDMLKDYTYLNKNWPKINIMVDLQESSQLIRLHWPRIKNQVLKLISDGTMEAGIINYDSDNSSLQVKDGVFNTAYLLENLELVSCKINGNVENCILYDCELDGSQLSQCSLYQGTKAKDSKVESCFTHGSVTLTNCYVAGRDSMFKGKMIGGIFREGFMSDDARFEDTEIVVSKKIKI